MFPQHIYHKLEGGAIRLLKIHSRSDFTLENTYWKNSAPYVAISHCWGDADDLCNVTINGAGVSLRKHVAAMLGSLYEHHHVNCIWLDMACINQCDLQEKAEQVSLMGQIYGKADQVYAWLGESDPEVDDIFDVLQQFRDYREHEHSLEHMDAAESLSFHRDSFRRIYQTRIGLMPEPSNSDGDDLHEELNLLRPFLMIPYWRRAWIIQELILAKTVIVCYGNRSIDLHDVYGTSLDWGSFEQGFDAGVIQIAGRTNLKQHSRAWKIIQAICGHRRLRKRLEWENGEEFRFLQSGNEEIESRAVVLMKMSERGDVAMFDEVIGLYAQNHCKHLRDKVYAFRELVPQWRENVVVDYDKKSDLEVFQDVVRLGLLKQQKHGGGHVAFWLWSAMNLGDRSEFDSFLREHLPEISQR